MPHNQRGAEWWPVSLHAADRPPSSVFSLGANTMRRITLEVNVTVTDGTNLRELRDRVADNVSRLANPVRCDDGITVVHSVREYGDPDLSGVVAPFVNMNGTSRNSLIENLEDVRQYIFDTIDRLRHCSPNGRDYCQGGSVSLAEATAQHVARAKALKSLADSIEAEIELILDNKQRFVEG